MCSVGAHVASFANELAQHHERETYGADGSCCLRLLHARPQRTPQQVLDACASHCHAVVRAEQPRCDAQQPPSQCHHAPVSAMRMERTRGVPVTTILGFVVQACAMSRAKSAGESVLQPIVVLVWMLRGLRGRVRRDGDKAAGDGRTAPRHLMATEGPRQRKLGAVKEAQHAREPPERFAHGCCFFVGVVTF